MVEREPEAVRIGDAEGLRVGRHHRAVRRALSDVGHAVGIGCRAGSDLRRESARDVRQARTGRAGLRRDIGGADGIGVVQAAQPDRPDVARLDPSGQLHIGAGVVRAGGRLADGGARGASRLRQIGRGHHERVSVDGVVAQRADLHVRRAGTDVGAVADGRIEEGVPVARRVDVLDGVALLEHRRRLEHELSRLVPIDRDLQLVVGALRDAVRVGAQRNPVRDLDEVGARGREAIGQEIIEPGGTATRTFRWV